MHRESCHTVLCAVEHLIADQQLGNCYVVPKSTPRIAAALPAAPHNHPN